MLIFLKKQRSNTEFVCKEAAKKSSELVMHWRACTPQNDLEISHLGLDSAAVTSVRQRDAKKSVIVTACGLSSLEIGKEAKSILGSSLTSDYI